MFPGSSGNQSMKKDLHINVLKSKLQMKSFEKEELHEEVKSLKETNEDIKKQLEIQVNRNKHKDLQIQELTAKLLVKKELQEPLTDGTLCSNDC